jgi:hypothetical protein
MRHAVVVDRDHAIEFPAGLTGRHLSPLARPGRITTPYAEVTGRRAAAQAAETR